MKYEEWEERHNMSPVGPEAWYAEKAWNTVVERMRILVKAAAKAEKTVGDMAVLLEEELVMMRGDTIDPDSEDLE